MNMPLDKVQYWLDIASYDFETAEAMQRTGRWLYVGFMCHQTIEKTLKAYWNAVREDDPPYIHNLKRLAAGTELFDALSEEQKDFIDRLTPLNIEARYPSYKDALAKSLNEEYCAKIIEETNNLKQWIEQKLLDLSENSNE